MSTRRTHDDTLAAEIAALRSIVGELARTLIEVQENIRELRDHVVADDDGLVPIKAAASIVGYDRETVRRWCIAGTVASVRRGVAWFVDMPSLRAHVAMQRRSTLALSSK